MRLVRLSKNLSQESVADELGLSVSAYSNMERGTIDITINRLMEVSRILEVNWLRLIDPDKESTIAVFHDAQEGYATSGKTFSGMDIEKELRSIRLELEKLKKRKKI